MNSILQRAHPDECHSQQDQDEVEQLRLDIPFLEYHDSADE